MDEVAQGIAPRPLSGKARHMTGADAVCRCLEEEGVDIIFGYPGGASLPIYDALYHSRLKHVLTRHEQGAVHAADGYARATGKVGVCMATSGPGATNLVTGLCNAQMDSIPIVAITGQVATGAIGKDAFQEADVFGISLPVTKHSYLVRDVTELPRILREAFHIASTGRPGPVLVDVPKDVSNAKFNFNYPRKVDLPGYKPTYDGHPAQIARAAELINSAERPYLYVGGGAIISGAAELVRELAEKADIPVTTTLMGLGAFPGDHPLFCGMPGMHGTVTAIRGFNRCDVLIALGVRFDDRVTGKLETFARQAKVIHVDIDPAEISKNIEAHIPIVGDLTRVLKLLVPKVKPNKHPEWRAQVDAWKREFPLQFKASPTGRARPQEVIFAMRETLPADAIVSVDVGQHQMWAAQFFPFRQPRTWLSSSGLGTMGFGLPAAIGAQFGRPDQPVWVVSGDGSFQMCMQELAVLVEHDLPVKIAIINNGYLGMVRQWQQLFYDNRYSQVRFTRNPDFVQLAKAFGIEGRTVMRSDEVLEAVRWAAATPGPIVLDFQVEEEDNVWPMIPSGASIDDVIVGWE